MEDGYFKSKTLLVLKNKKDVALERNLKPQTKHFNIKRQWRKLIIRKRMGRVCEKVKIPGG